MPRMSRVKPYNAIHHVMCRSISEIDLLKDDEDKLRYIDLLKSHMSLHKFKIYGYCFMKNHLHLIFDSNGADISMVMHSINFAYAKYYNKKYKRHGHLFQDRFKSKVVYNNKYLVALSAYIHNNVLDIKGYETCPESYKFSSLAVYLGIHSDPFGLVDFEYILSMLGGNLRNSRERYYDLVFKCDHKSKTTIEFEDEKTLYLSQRIVKERKAEPSQVEAYVVGVTQTPSVMLHAKNIRGITIAKALLIGLLRSACRLNISELCEYIGNVSQANISRWLGLSINMLKIDMGFVTLFNSFA